MQSGIRKGPIAAAGVKLSVNGVANSRDSRFDDKDEMFSPVGVQKLLQSKTHIALFKTIVQANRTFNIILSTPTESEHNKKVLSKLAFAAASDTESLRSVLVTVREKQEYIAVFNDRFHHNALAMRLGITKAEDTVLVSFFMFEQSGGLTCLISINPDDALDEFIAKIGEKVSYADWCCGGCGIVTDRRLKCGTCRCAIYCSKACQLGDWPSHRLVCDR